MRFDADAGEHNVVISYFPRGLVVGAIISIVCIIVLIFTIVFERKIE